MPIYIGTRLCRDHLSMLLLAVLRRARSVFLLTAGNEGNGTNAVGDSIPYPPSCLEQLSAPTRMGLCWDPAVCIITASQDRLWG